MANISRVAGNIWTGGDLREDPEDGLADLADLVSAGITHIIDNRLEWSDEDLVADHAPHIEYLYNPTDDAGERMADSWFDLGVAFARRAIAADPNAQVLAHCHMGINRGPSLAYAILLELGSDPVEAIAAIRAARPIANVWYAADALDWYHRTHGVSPSRRLVDQARLAAWREEHPLDVVRIIRAVRNGEDPLEFVAS